jgi:aspartyl-tRNA(Asn)/glutamyl-tRNA(Gln) amidotransferase subunit A
MPFELTITEAADLIRRGELSPVELTSSYLDRIHRLDSRVGAFVELTSEAALTQARLAEAEIRSGNYRGPLHGTVFAVKDQLDAADAPSFMRGSKAGDHATDAVVIARLKAAGAIYIGKLVMSGQPGQPQPKNPWSLERVTGGSSSGPAAAVAARFCTASLGEDSAGSIRNPASLCGLVGVIGTYGRVTRSGLASMGWTIDHCGPLAWTVRDAAHILETIAGHNPQDRATTRAAVPMFTAGLGRDINGLRVGVPFKAVESPAMDVRPDILAAFTTSLGTLESQGAEIVEVTVPFLEEATHISYVLYIGEYAAEYRDQMEWTSTHARDARLIRLALGALTTASDYLQAQRVRTRMRRECQKVFGQVDVLVTPTMTATAEKASSTTKPLDLWWTKPGFTPLANVLGVPAMTVPCGFDPNGLPIGLQVIGQPFDEATVLSVAYAYEQATPWHIRRPGI